MIVFKNTADKYASRVAMEGDRPVAPTKRIFAIVEARHAVPLRVRDEKGCPLVDDRKLLVVEQQLPAYRHAFSH